MEPVELPELLTVEQVVTILHVSKDAVYAFIAEKDNDKRLHAINVGTGQRKIYRISQSELKRFMQARET